jgi:hypothetical protein
MSLPIVAQEAVIRLASRDATRTEADIQADIYLLLTTGSLNLAPDQVAKLETPTKDGTRRRLDVEIGHAVIEVKKDLRLGGVLKEAEQQLAGYVNSRTALLGTRYVGILTDGTGWILYHLVGGSLEQVTKLSMESGSLDPDRLVAWLEAVLATDSAIKPTPDEIHRRLGVQSPAYLLDHATLAALYKSANSNPEVALKRDLWAKLLRTAFGSGFQDKDRLFVDHTLLVMTAEIIAHAALGFDVSAKGQLQPAQLTTGVAFASAQIHGVVEADFFDWVLQVPGGSAFIRTLADRLARFDWAKVEHDVLKVLYESVIEQSERQRLGEYYTPDWLAYRMVSAHVTDPLHQRALDPSCGSGTFLFHLVRAYLAAADASGVPNGKALDGVTASIFGMDIHPVAVTLARVTYLLAIGPDRLAAGDRGPLSVPVYLGDSMQWEQHNEYLSDAKTVTIGTSGQDLVEGGGGGLWGDDLVFPKSVLHDAGQFDRLVATLADKASDVTSKSDSDVILTTLHQFGVHESDVPVLVATFGVLRNLRRNNRDHIWGYYVRNLIRPLWLSEKANRADVLIGNPPWLRYGQMQGSMQKRFTAMSKDRGLITGRLGTSGRDLSTLFVVRCAELYSRPTGRLAFIMPHGTLTRKPHDHFRSGNWTGDIGSLTATMRTAWDLSQAATGFPMTSCVVSADLTPGKHRRIPATVDIWTSSGSKSDVTWGEMKKRLTIKRKHLQAATEADLLPVSAYKKRFRQGAIIVPRVLFFVNEAPAGPLGAGAGRVLVESRRTTQEKTPWRDVEGIQAPVERAFIRPVHLGETVLPYRTTAPLQAVLPVSPDSTGLLKRDQIDSHPALDTYWREAEKRWEATKKKSDSDSLLDRVNFHQQLAAQLPPAFHRVIYTASGSTLVAARVPESQAVIEHGLYWGAVSSIDEARYLVAILNSETVLERVKPLQSIGLFGPRHFDKYVFSIPIPVYDENEDLHSSLKDLAMRAEGVAASVKLVGSGFKAQRSAIRTALVADGVKSEIEALVSELIPPLARADL